MLDRLFLDKFDGDDPLATTWLESRLDSRTLVVTFTSMKARNICVGGAEHL